YLDEVRSGEEVLVKERNKPVVKLVLLNGNGHSKISSPPAKPMAKKKAGKPRALPPLKDDPLYISDEELEIYHAKLVAEGGMTLPKVEPTPEFWEEFFNEPRPNISLDEIRQWINEDRDED
ncbi:MAG: hypothetical protein AAB401_18890, partial [Acidobacteriota bacterium]